MSDIILLEPEDLVAKADEVNRIRASHDKVVSTVQNIIRSLEKEWTGAAQKELLSQLEAMKPLFEKFSYSLGEYGKAMKICATSLRDKDEQAGKYFDKLD